MRRELEYSSNDYDEKMEMEPRPQSQGFTHSAMRIGSFSSRRTNGRTVSFEGIPERAPTRREGTMAEDSNGRSQERENTQVNLPPLLAAHLGRNEAGVLLQPSHTSGVEGDPLLFSMGETFLPMVRIPNSTLKLTLQTFTRRQMDIQVTSVSHKLRYP